MSESVVQRKVAKLIQQEIGDILRKTDIAASGVLITVTVVRVTKDLSIAKVYLSTLPDSRLQETVDSLNENAWDIRYQLAARIKNKMRKMPELRFYIDDSFAEAEKIDQIFQDIDIPPAEDEDQAVWIFPFS